MIYFLGGGALLHKQAEDVAPQPQTDLRHHHRRGRAESREAIEDRGAHLQLSDLAVEVTCHDPLTEKFEAAHFRLHEATPMIAGPCLPYFSAKAARGGQDGIASFSAGMLILPWLGVLAGWDDGLHTALRNSPMAALGVIGAITIDARDALPLDDLLEQARQHRGVAGGVVGHLDRPDLQRIGVNVQVDLAPLTTIIGSMLLRFPLAFAKHLDARAIDQHVQSRGGRPSVNHHRQALPAPADGAEVRHLPVQAGQVEQALRHSHRLAQGQVEQALDRQAELNRCLAVLRDSPAVAAGAAVPAHVLVQLDEQRATGLQCCVIFFQIGRTILRLCWGTHDDSLPAHRLGCRESFMRQRPLALLGHSCRQSTRTAARL